jgi:hypothetical protein
MKKIGLSIMAILCVGNIFAKDTLPTDENLPTKASILLAPMPEEKGSLAEQPKPSSLAIVEHTPGRDNAMLPPPELGGGKLPRQRSFF